MASAPNTARPYSQVAYSMSNGAQGAPTVPQPGAAPLLPNQGRVIQQGSIRVLCIADVRGNLRSLNDLAREARASYIVHTGDFGFYDENSLDRIAEKTLRHVAQYSPLLTDHVKRQIGQSPAQPSIKERFSRDQLPLSELPFFLNKTYSLEVPVYTVWGACEDVQVLEKLRSGEYKVDNLHIIDEAHSRLLDIGGVKLRLLGLGGAVVMHKLFDNGEGRTTIAGGQGTMWTTLLQMGELVDTASRVYDPTETRVFVTHASPAREGLLNQLSVTLKADFSISAGLHFRYGSSYNEFSVNPTLDHYRGKLAASKASFDDVWQTVKQEVEPAVAENDSQQKLLAHALELVAKMPSVAQGGNPFGGSGGAPGTGQIDESAFKNMWNFNLADAAYGWLVLDVEGGRIGTEMRAQGFNFAHRTGKAAPHQPAQPATTASQPPQGPPSQPRSQQPPTRQNPSQSPATRGPGPQAIPNRPKDDVKTGPSEKSSTSDVKTNGAAAQDKAADKPQTPVERKPQSPIYGLFVKNVTEEDQVRAMIAEEDKSKVEKVVRSGQFFIVHFKSQEDQTAAYEHIAKEHKDSRGTSPNISIYQQRPRGGADRWGTDTRTTSGYRSGGASDSETGRGGFRGRGRGGRGGERGSRGNPRGRGGFGTPKGESATPASSTPAPPSADAN
ncbi:hypothetical protein BT63DRAFT_241307 [Microthyrium microscopicum]|uniref:Uncharacterized protein n=1 Tax=Microthyrium microscopicum TaxID=703497 RepID=A0A6A6UEG9_9PEZI|nr:hypothetical protein BT63DRAFT_241307 [Microthyrium microscopicum]